MRFRFHSKLTIIFLALIVLATAITFSTIKRSAFASNAATSTTPVVIFNGVSTNFTNQLWMTNGTVAGTKPVTKFGYSLNPSSITSLGTTAVFASQFTLWATNGTQAGTQALTNIPNAASTGITPSDITAFGNQALFDGYDSSGNDEIWITDGTAANTKEITNIPDAGSFGTSLGGIATFGNQALFSGIDTHGNACLWVTDGTSAGTHELSAMTQNGLVYPAGNEITAFGNKALFNGTINGLNSELWVTDGTTGGTQALNTSEPFDIAPFGNQALFATLDGNLWITDGTPAGTKEVTNNAYNLSPTGITAFGNKALFAGTDASGNNSIWVTDGTPAGTQELITVGVNYSTYTNDITAFGNSAVFYAVDAKGFGELWTTDGTKAGTQELTSIGSNFYNGLQPTDITVYGNILLFNGYDAFGNNALWKTNDTVAGTQELKNVAGSDTTGFYPSDMTVLNSSSTCSGSSKTSASAASCSNLWGVDSYGAITTLYPQVTKAYGVPDFWGRYIGTGRAKDISTSEVTFAHGQGLAILPIYFNYSQAAVNTKAEGIAYAKAAIADAQQRLSIPQGVAIFVDIEEKAGVTTNADFIQAWYDQFNTSFTYTYNKQTFSYQAGYYKAGYYGNPNTGTISQFATAYCGAVSREAQIGTNSFIWTTQPNFLHRTTKNNAPVYKVHVPNCANQTPAWQYAIQGPNDPAPPNVDTDEALTTLPLWHP